MPSPEWDAELLLRHVLGWTRADVVVRDGETLPDEPAAAFDGLVERRAARVPLQHLTGVQEFWGRSFRVTRDTLVPRPETEVLVEGGLAWLAGQPPGPVVVDVGTGTGCIALSLAADRPDAVVHAIDASVAALAVAKDNARRLGVERVRFHHGDLLQPLRDVLAGQVDLIVSNPPYVSADEAARLLPEVRDHDPRMALVPPSGDAYEVYRRLAPQAAGLLRPEGRLMVEIGQGMEEGVLAICTAAGLRLIRVEPDLQGIPRVVTAAL